MTSIRKALVVPIVGGLLLLALVSGILGFIWARQSLTNQVDSILAAKARALANLVEEDEDEIHFEFADDNMPEFTSNQAQHFFQVWLSNGTELARSRSLNEGNLTQVAGTQEKPGSMAVKLPNGLNGRAVGFQFDPILEEDDIRSVGAPKVNKATIVVARDSRELDATLANLLIIIACFLLFLPAGSAIIVMVAVRRGLRPLNALAEIVGGIHVGSLKTKLSAGEDVAELQPIVTRLNELFNRLDAAYKRERRFTMDASHELRTPLAESRVALEIALKWPDDRKLLIDSAKQALEATYQMESLVAVLLSLTRSDSDSAEAPHEHINLEEVTRACWSNMADLASSKKLELSISCEADEVRSNRHLITAIIMNLVSNAVQYSHSGSVVQCTINRAIMSGGTELHLSNIMAVPLNGDDLDHLFEPLWRKDKSRTENPSSSSSHFGLGLSLVKAFTDKLGILVEPSIVDETFIITLIFP